MKFSIVIAALVGAWCAVAPAVASEKAPDRTAEAKALFAMGQQMFDEGRYSEAAMQFSKAYAAAPRPQVLYNIALSYDKAGDVVTAIESYRWYLSEAPENEQSDPVRKRIADLESQTGQVTADCGMSPCTIYVDGKEQSQVPANVLLMPGNHVFSAMREEQTADEIEILVRKGDKISVMLATGSKKAPVVVAAPAPKPVPAKEPESKQPETAKKDEGVPMGIPFWVASSATVAAGVTAVVFGVKTLGDQKKFKDSGGLDKGIKEDGERDRLLTNIFIGVTAAAGATAVAFAVYEIWFADDKDAESVSLAPFPGLGLAAVGRF